MVFQQNPATFAQNIENEESPAISRGSIPEELLRPRRGEAPRYPIDTVIGPIGQGSASDEAYAFARNVASALVYGRMNAPSLSTINTAMLESYLGALDAASPRSFRLGSGREEADGSFSFLAHFIGREQSIIGELFIRPGQQRRRPAQANVTEGIAPNETDVTETAAAQAAGVPQNPVWIFDELILEETRSRKAENEEVRRRFDFPPYERFF